MDGVRMAVCWKQRGCDEEMMATCPHATSDLERCPSRCAYAACERSTHELTWDPELVFSDEIDRTAAIKDTCLYCAFFLTNGPRLG